MFEKHEELETSAVIPMWRCNQGVLLAERGGGPQTQRRSIWLHSGGGSSQKTGSNEVCTADGVHDIVRGTANDNVLLAKQDGGRQTQRSSN